LSDVREGVRQWVSNFLVGISLALLVVVCGLWARGYWRMEEAFWKIRLEGWAPVPVRGIYVRSVQGCIEVGTFTEKRFEYREWQPEMWTYSVSYYRPVHPGTRILDIGWKKMYAGFGIMGENIPDRSDQPLSHMESIWAAWAPSWFPAIVFAALPSKWVLLLLMSKRRREKGLCEGCGYDLRCSPERCPKCGTPAKLMSEAPVPL
jgi:hypothetical protein